MIIIVADILIFAIENEPINGILTGNGIEWIYQPNLNYHGTDVFYFTATDGNWISDPVAVTINIQSVNDIPTIEDISIISPESPSFDEIH